MSGVVRAGSSLVRNTGRAVRSGVSSIGSAISSATSSSNLKTAVRIAAPIAIGFAAPAVGAAIAKSWGISSVLGTAAVTGITGGVLGGVTARATGGDWRTGAALGGVAGGAAGFQSARAASQVAATPTSGTMASGAARSAPQLQAAPTAGLDLSSAATLPTTANVGIPTSGLPTATGSQSLMAANAGVPTIGAGGANVVPALNLQQAVSPEQAVAARSISQVPTDQMTAGGIDLATAQTPDVSDMRMVTNAGLTPQTQTMPALNTDVPLTSWEQPIQQVAQPQQTAQFMTSTPTITRSDPFAGASATNVGAPQTPPPVEGERGFFGDLYDRFTDGSRWADFAIMAGTQVLSGMLLSPEELTFDPEDVMPDYGGFDISEIQSQLSPEEQELYQLMLEDMKRLAEQDQELFLERMNLARGLIGEANYFDPEYWGSRAMAQTRVAAGRAGREAERERALTGRGPSDADRRQREIDAALAGQSAYTEAADTAGGRRLSTLQQAAGLMPSSPPGRMDTSGLMNLSQTGYDRMQQDFQNQLSAARQFDASRGAAFDIYRFEQGRLDQRAAAAQQGLGGLAQAFMSTS